ncbi:sulfur carrier protein ThiS [Spirochaetia bacterium 38H-sp]|uniref:Sulfur carrier protein ThiS n=1 Tax=Rarispira pelagica TaxID=3141764 RepID=A0ABU9UAM7_9SPIR
MNLIVNGESVETKAKTVSELLAERGVTNRVAVEVDGHVVPYDEFSGYTLREGSHVEIIAFVGGGCG